MSRLAIEHGAVNLGQGFPDFPGPDFVKEAAKAAIDADLNQYAVSARRAAAARGHRRTWTRPLRDGRSTPTARSPSPPARPRRSSTRSRPSSAPATRSSSSSRSTTPICRARSWPARRCAPVTLRPPDWSFDPDEAAAAFGPRTRLLLLNTPHNPTGKVFTRGRAGDAGRALPAVGRRRGHRRGLRPDRLRRRRARAAGDAAGHVGADADDQLDRQDLLDDRLEDRLRGRPGGA